MLKAIEIENFKAVSERIRVEFAPVTLLFGRNSAGKSTVIQAIQYLREVLRDNLDARGTERGGSAIDLGGFRNFVHGAEPNPTRSVWLKAEFTSGETAYDLRSIPVEDPPEDRVDAIEVEVRWSDLLRAPEVRTVRCFVGGAHVVTVEISEGGKDMAITELVPEHPILTVESYEEYLDEGVAALERFMGGVPGRDAGARIPVTLHPLHTVWLSSAEGSQLARSARLENEWFAPGQADNEAIRSSADQHEKEARKRLQAFGHFLEATYFGLADRAKHVLEAFRYIGPLREVPARVFDPDVKPDEARWSHGLAAWDALHTAPAEEVVDVSRWLSQEDRLGTGYQLRLREVREVDLESPLAGGLARGELGEEDFDYAAAFDALPVKRYLTVFDEVRRIHVAPYDVGVGISQLVPVVAASRLTPRGQRPLICVEQPELHVHPAVQTGIGDLLAASAGDRDFLIETHSEHLVLRLLRRIRETAEDELPPGAPALKPEQLSVNYLDLNEGGVLEASRLRVDETGAFLDRWPRGFFEERLDEVS